VFFAISITIRTTITTTTTTITMIIVIIIIILIMVIIVLAIIVIKPDSGVDSARGWIAGYMGQPRKINFFFEVLIFHIKKLRNNLSEYRLYML
jgi:hypothetical protein